MGFLAGLLGRSVGFFGGGLKGKLILAGTVASVVAMGALSVAVWFLFSELEDANKANGRMLQAVGDYKEAINGLNADLAQAKADNDDLLRRKNLEIELTLANAAEQARIADEARATAETIRKLLDEDPEAKAWGDTVVPAGVIECLRRGGSGNCADNRTTTP